MSSAMAHLRDLLAGIVIPDTLRIVTPLAILRVLSPALVLLTALTIIPARPPLPKSPSPITPVVVATESPRRALILCLITLASLTFLLDGLTFVVYAVLDKQWPQATGIEVGAVEGVIAYAGLAAIGAWKDIHGVEVWLMKRVKAGLTVAFFVDIGLVVILTSKVESEWPSLFNPRFIYDVSTTEPFSIRSLLHIVYPAFRIILLLPLLVALASPRVSYVPVESTDEEAPTDTSLLLPAGEGAAPSTGLSPVSAEASKYGTFRTSRSALTTSSGPTTRTPTPAPSHVRVPRPKVECKQVYLAVTVTQFVSELWFSRQGRYRVRSYVG